MFIGFICWTVVGLIIGFIASKVVRLRNDDPKVSILLGGAGGVIGGFLCNVFTVSGAAGFNGWSLLFAVLGAAAAVVVWEVRRGFAARSGPYRGW